MRNAPQNWYRRAITALSMLMILTGSALSAGAAPVEKRFEMMSTMMVALQVVTETYAINHQDRYPKNLAELYRAALSQKYWVDTVRFTRQRPGEEKVLIQVPLKPVLYLDATPQQEVTGIATISSQPAQG